MKYTAMSLVLALCLLLCGCSALLKGEYIWEQNHDIPSAPDSGQDIVVSDYSQLVRVISESAQVGTELFTVSVAQYDRSSLERDVARAVDAVRSTNPIAAYAVSDSAGRSWRLVPKPDAWSSGWRSPGSTAPAPAPELTATAWRVF